MDCLVMCGGRGTRLGGDREKPLARVAGRPMLAWVLRAVQTADRVDRTYAVVSPATPDTRAFAADRVPVIETAGDGYVADLCEALERVTRPTLTVAADLPTLAAPLVDRLVARADGTTTVVVPASLKRTLGASVDEQPYRGPNEGAGERSPGADGFEWVPTGVNVVSDDADEPLDSWDARVAVNVNYPIDVSVAERLVEPGRSDA